MTDTKPRSFWGRVSEFVKNPTQDWSLTRHEGALREQQEQERVKAREEQRKLDAFIRRRELAALRRLRRRQADGVPIDGLPSDVPDTDGAAALAPQREATLRKINEIERMMSAPDSRATRSRLTRSSGLSGAELAHEADAIRVRAAPTTDDTVPMAPPDAGTDLAFPVTDMHAPAAAMTPAPAPLSLLSELAPTVQQGNAASTLPLAATQLAPTRPADGAWRSATQVPLPNLDAVSSGLSSSPRQASDAAWSRPAALAVDVQEGVSASPLFDQACIDFANADDADAERALLEAISGSPDRELESEFWLALFDLYRAGGNQARFDALVADYVDRFQSSAPSWGTPAAAPSAPAGGATSAFTALGELDAAQARALLLLARSGAAQVALDFNALTTVAPAALAQALEALRALDAAAGCSIELGGVDNLVDACAVAAPPMQRDLDPTWWHLRLEALRMAGRQDAFENVALDFCVTYEISPPTWEPPKARVRVLQAEFGMLGDGPATRTPRGARSAFGASQFGGSGFSATTTGLALARLEGEIAGGSEDFLKPLDRVAAGSGGVIVNLGELRRLDFSSAGIILNWVMAQTAAGRSVRFEGVHRLIAGLFVILGINSVAQIELRRS
jgi:anti-anti-sigma regulatory factor